MIDRDRIKAFLDDLALISAKHDMTVTADEWVEFRDGAPDGYSYDPEKRDLYSDLHLQEYVDDPCMIFSLDVSTITAHQRIALAKVFAQLREIAR